MREWVNKYKPMKHTKRDQLRAERFKQAIKSRVPDYEDDQTFFSQLRWNGIYYGIVYGASIIRWFGVALKIPFITEPAAHGFKRFVNWKYGIEQKSITEVFDSGKR